MDRVKPAYAKAKQRNTIGWSDEQPTAKTEMEEGFNFSRVKTLIF